MSDTQRAPVGVRFKEAGKVYYFDAGDVILEVGNYVVVETSHGLEIGRVVIAPDQVLANQIKETLKPIVRIATPEDLEQRDRLREQATEQLREAKHQVAEAGMDMQIVSGEYDLDGGQITFYFTSTKERTDFRSLARDLTSQFHTRVQMLQVGERDRAKLLDGYDVCGQRLCCASWQTSFPSVSIKMAKEQDLPLNPQKISGVCGRLYCCLTFEYEGYREIRGQMPKVGSMVSTPLGEAKVNSVNLMSKIARLWLTEQHQVVEMPVVDLQMQYGTTIRPMELVREIEAPLKAAPAVAAGEMPAAFGVPSAPGAPAEGGEAVQTGDAEQKRRRRGRRGGRNRRREGGTGDGGGSTGEGNSGSESGNDGGAEASRSGPPPGPPGD
jgi:cell fate regulator YaaT (PSP1 superfamily)